jgi:hypothetical protein
LGHFALFRIKILVTLNEKIQILGLNTIPSDAIALHNLTYEALPTRKVKLGRTIKGTTLKISTYWKNSDEVANLRKFANTYEFKYFPHMRKTFYTNFVS